jgi:hypothetical protein
MFSDLFDDRKVKGPMDFDMGPNGMGLDLLRAVYRNPGVDLSIRMRAAMACLPFEAPKLAVTALIDNEKDFAAILDRRIKHMEALRTNGVRSNDVKVIEARPEPRTEPRLIRRI